MQTTTRRRNRKNDGPPRFRTWHRFCLVALICIANFDASLFAEAYRLGDIVDAAVSTRSSLSIDMLMHNMPTFGLTKQIYLPRLPERFSLSFEDGLHSLPYVDGQKIEGLVVTFVYSKSGDGRIHSVSSKAIPTTRAFSKDQEFEVLFEWVEEASVDLEAGTTIMFLAAFLVSVLFFLQLCSMDDPDEYDSDEKSYNSNNLNNHAGTYFKVQ